MTKLLIDQLGQVVDTIDNNQVNGIKKVIGV